MSDMIYFHAKHAALINYDERAPRRVNRVGTFVKYTPGYRGLKRGWRFKVLNKQKSRFNGT